MNRTPRPSNARPPARVALVTGAARRIGASIARELSAQGWAVVIHCRRSLAEARALAAELEAHGGSACVVTGALDGAAAAERLYARASRCHGRIDCVVNNAALFEYDAPQGFDAALLERHMRLNVAVPAALARSLHASLTGTRRGVVVNLLDQKLANPNPDYFSYTLSKAALAEATRLSALAFAPKLRVVGIAPGLTLLSGDQTPAGFARAHRMTPLGRSSTPADIARAVAWVAAEPAITGTTIYVDGGQHLAPSRRDVMFVGTGARRHGARA
jgi:NAD(P)-dependent dehydrogenase (short-subunit alcohol dehydrogenase family)